MMSDGTFSIIQVDDYKEEYLKLMSMYAILLAQSVEDPIVSDVEYAYDADGAANGTSGGFSGHAEMRDGRGGAGGGGEREVALYVIWFSFVRGQIHLTNSKVAMNPATSKFVEGLWLTICNATFEHLPKSQTFAER